MDYQLILGDCLEVMRTMNAGSVDAVITDLPYGTTACAWDTVIPFAPMWEQVKRILKPRGVFVTTASQPFTSALVMSNLDWFKYEWIWNKNTVTGVAISEYMPLRSHESICVFCDGRSTYNKQVTLRFNQISAKRYRTPVQSGISQNHYPSLKPMQAKQYDPDFVNPRSSLAFDSVHNAIRVHPTEKPVALYSYLIRTYTNAGDTVFDFCAGSGTTGVAAIKEGRNFVGVELDAGYYRIAEKRIAEAAMQLPLLEIA